MSDYAGFHVTKENNDGVIEQLPGVTVKVYNADADVEITTLTTGANGEIVAGSLAVAAGTRVRFRVENSGGLAGSVTQILPSTNSTNLILRQRGAEVNVNDESASPVGYYQDFHVYKENNNGVIVSVPGAVVRVFNPETNAAVAVLQSDENGYIPAGFFNVAAGTRVHFRVESFQGLAGSITQHLASNSNYAANPNLVLDDREPNGFTEAVSGEIFWRYEDEPDAEPVFLGEAVAGKELKVPFDFKSARAVRFFLIPKTAFKSFGATRAVEGAQKLFNPNTETGVPLIYQSGASANASVTVAVERYTASAQYRKIQVSATADFAAFAEDVQNTVNEPGQVLNPFVVLTRATNLAAAETKYVRVAHSSNGSAYGEFSNALAVTFADSGGTGGTSGGGGFGGPHKFEPEQPI